MTGRPIKVVIVDDSAVVRKLLADALSTEPGIKVVGLAADPFMARELILQHEPDVITLDVEMPRMDGVSFLARIMAHRPMPVIIVSSIAQSGSVAAVEALRLGAIDVIAKPGGPQSVGQVAEQIKRSILSLRGAPAIRLRTAPPAPPPPAPALAGPTARKSGLILIGASTGGTQAIETVLTRLPANSPPILIVQHMPAGFTAAFAERMDRVCALTVREARGGELLAPGLCYIAPGGRHMVVEQNGLKLMTGLRDGPPVHYQRPAVDVLFHSAARLRGIPLVAAVLTGMGADGADGLLALRRAGAETFAQDEQSCVVFGMPKEAIANGGAAHVETIYKLPMRLLERMGALQSGRVAASA